MFYKYISLDRKISKRGKKDVITWEYTEREIPDERVDAIDFEICGNGSGMFVYVDINEDSDVWKEKIKSQIKEELLKAKEQIELQLESLEKVK